jgi:hypothetical protein
MTGFSGLRLRGILLIAVVFAGATFVSTNTASAQGRIVCKFGSAKYQHCCRESYRGHPHLGARARADDIDECMSGSSSDREETKSHAKARARDDQEETRKKTRAREESEEKEETTKKKSETSSQDAKAIECSGPPSGKAGVHRCPNFSVWLPADWKVKTDEDGLTAESEDLSVLAGWLDDTELKDKDVTEFIEDEIDEAKVTSDQKDKRDDMEVRLMEGTGRDTDEDEDLTFRALALGTDDGVIEAVVYGDPDAMKQNESVIDRILTSLNKP